MTTNSPRDINVLLTLNTYQGMTDEEIDMIINYKISVGVQAEVSQQCINSQIAASNELVSTSLQAKNAALQMLQTIVNKQTTYRSV